MSGGSFDYLYQKELEHFVSHQIFWDGDWSAMVSELDELCPEAANEMRKLREEAEKFRDEFEARWAKLQPLLHDIEWWRSFDYGKDQVDEAIAKYRSSV